MEGACRTSQGPALPLGVGLHLQTWCPAAMGRHPRGHKDPASPGDSLGWEGPTQTVQRIEGIIS